MEVKEYSWSIRKIALTTYDAALKSILFDGGCGLIFEGKEIFDGKISPSKLFEDIVVGFSVNLARGLARDISNSDEAQDILGHYSAFIPWVAGAVAGGLKSQIYKNEPFIKGAFKILTYEYLEDLPKDDNAKDNIFKSFAKMLIIEEAGEFIHYLFNSYYNLSYNKLENIAMTAIGTFVVTNLIQGSYISLKEIDNDVIDYVLGNDINIIGSDNSHEL